MNRRVFAAAGLAALLSGSSGAVSHQSAQGIQPWVWVSEFTGAEVSDDSSMWFVNQFGINEGGWESLNLMSAAGSLHFQFVPEDLIAPNEYAARLVEGIGTAKVTSSDDFPDGGFAIVYSPPQNAPFGQIAYCEYQLGAFPGYNLQIRLWSREDHFSATFPNAQDVNLAGLPPFLFLTESDVESLDIAALSASRNTSMTRTSRTSNSMDSSDTAQTSLESSPNVDSNEVGDGYATIVKTHREEFLKGFDAFYDHLLNLGDMEADEKSSVLTTMVNLALTWQTYPSLAAEHASPSGMETLGTLYLDWADYIGEMGVLFEQIYMGEDVSNEFVEVTTAWQGIDFLLEIELGRHVLIDSNRAESSMVVLLHRVEAMAMSLD